MLKEVKHKLKMLQSSNRAALMQAATAEFQQKEGASDDDLEGGSSQNPDRQIGLKAKKQAMFKKKVGGIGAPKTNNFLE